MKIKINEYLINGKVMEELIVKDLHYKGEVLPFEIVEKLPEIGDMVEPNVLGETELVKVKEIKSPEILINNYHCYLIYKDNGTCDGVAIRY